MNSKNITRTDATQVRLMLQNLPNSKKTAIPSADDEIGKFADSFFLTVLEPNFSNEIDAEIALYILIELLNNAHEHGNKMNCKKCIYISWCIKKDCLKLSIEDEGTGFIPAMPPAEPAKNSTRGRGIWSIYLDAAHFEYNNIGNRATITFRRRKKDGT